MIKPTMPNMPGMGAMTDTLEFVKNLWGGMGVPGATMPNMPGIVMPTLSIEEINKQIADLRAVESWLGMNMNMLRGTIQALEVQSATIASLQAMGDSFSSAVKSNADAAADAVRAATTPHAAPEAEAGWPASSSLADEVAARSEKRRSAGSGTNEDSRPGAKQHTGHAGKAGAKAAAKPAAAKSAAEEAASPGSGSGDFGAPLANPAVWWNMLQDQFKQAVGNAMASEPAASAEQPDAAGKASSHTGKGGAKRRKPKPGIKSL